MTKIPGTSRNMADAQIAMRLAKRRVKHAQQLLVSSTPGSATEQQAKRVIAAGKLIAEQRSEIAQRVVGG